MARTATRTRASKSSTSTKTAARATKARAAQPAWRESLEQALSAGKGAVEFVQQRGQKSLKKALQEAQRRSSALTFKAREAAEQRLESVAGKVVGTWDQVEQAASERVGRTLNRLGVPSQKDIDRLTRSVAKLSSQIEQLSVAAAKAPRAAAPRASSRRSAAAAA